MMSKPWFRGLIAALVSGGASGIINALAAIGIDPSHFNFAGGLGNTLKLAIVGLIINGILGAALYLKQSPLPANTGGV